MLKFFGWVCGIMMFILTTLVWVGVWVTFTDKDYRNAIVKLCKEFEELKSLE